MTGQADKQAGYQKRLEKLLDRDPREWRSALDQRYADLDDVLAGRRRAVVYPAARMGREAAKRLVAAGVQVVALGDRDPELQGSDITGIPVISPSQIAADHRSDVILVASTMHDSAICEEFRALGCESIVPVGYLNLRLPDIFGVREYDGAWDAATDAANRSDIEAAFGSLSDLESQRVFVEKLSYYLTLEKTHLDAIRSTKTIYFDADVYELRQDEIVVDGGAFIGDTLESFLDACRGRFGTYVAFEPDRSSYSQVAALAEADPERITAVRAGLAGRTSSARLLARESADSRLLTSDESGGEQVEVVALDEYFEERPAPSLIKLDIEGAEADALAGAKQLLERASPTVAASAYHFPTDLWTLPLLIKRLMPQSRIFLRHYTREIDDTVCYAITDRKAA